MTFTILIISAAKNVGVSSALLLAICTHESGLKNVIAYNDGNSHSYGICQIKKETAQMLGFKGKALDLMNPEVNAIWAAKYIKFQEDRYGKENWCKITAAYNAGKYSESEIVPGKPKNLKYVRLVQKKLDPRLRGKLDCNGQ